MFIAIRRVVVRSGERVAARDPLSSIEEDGGVLRVELQGDSTGGREMLAFIVLDYETFRGNDHVANQPAPRSGETGIAAIVRQSCENLLQWPVYPSGLRHSQPGQV